MHLNSLGWRPVSLMLEPDCRYLAWRFTLSNFTFAITRSTTELVALGMFVCWWRDTILGHNLTCFRLLLWINQIILIC